MKFINEPILMCATDRTRRDAQNPKRKFAGSVGLAVGEKSRKVRVHIVPQSATINFSLSEDLRHDS